MMTIDDIKALIAADESRTLELKKSTGKLNDDMHDERIRAHEPKVYSWENMTGEGMTLADMDEGKVRNGIRRGIDGGRILAIALTEPIRNILAKWKLLKNNMLRDKQSAEGKFFEPQIKQASANLIKTDEMGNQQVRMAVPLNHHFHCEGLEVS